MFHICYLDDGIFNCTQKRGRISAFSIGYSFKSLINITIILPHALQYAFNATGKQGKEIVNLCCYNRSACCMLGTNTLVLLILLLV